MLSNGSSITEVLSVTILGLVIVFVVLIILLFVLKLMSLFSHEAKTENAVTEQTPNIQPISHEEDEDELVAVLTAAVAASLKTSTYNLKIKSYKRLNAKGTK